MLKRSLLVRKKPLHSKNNKEKIRCSYGWFVAVAEQYLLCFFKCIFNILKKKGGEGKQVPFSNILICLLFDS